MSSWPGPDGPATAIPADALSGAFAEHLARDPDRVAMRFPDGRGGFAALTYRELAARVDSRAAAMRRAGVRPGMRACLLVPPGPECTALLFALGRLEAVPVLIDPVIGLRALRRCVAEARPEALVGVPRAHLARVVFRWPGISVPIAVGSRGLRRGWLARRSVPSVSSARPDADFIAFTSGSTGPAKPVAYRARHLAAQLAMAGRLLGLAPGEPCLSAFALFVVGGPALGLEFVVPDTDLLRPAEADPAKLVAAIERFGVRGLLGSPAVLEVLSRYCLARGLVLGTVRRVVSAGASLTAGLARRLRRCLPADAQVHSVYGMTECLPVSAIESRDLLAEAVRPGAVGGGTCLGVPLADNVVRVIPVSGEPIAEWRDDLALPAGAVGEITVTGPSTSEAYPGRLRETALAKIAEGDRVVHRTGDLGCLDARGRLWFHGRLSQRLRTARGDLPTEQVEPIADAVEGVRRSALVGVGPPAAQVPVLCVEAEPGADHELVRRRVLDRLARFPHTREIRRVLFHRRFPVDPRHNSKIIRERLARWADRRSR